MKLLNYFQFQFFVTIEMSLLTNTLLLLLLLLKYLHSWVLYCKTGGNRWTHRLTVHLSPSDLCLIFLLFLFCMYSFVKQNRDAISRRSSINSIQSPWVITLCYNILLLVSSPSFLIFSPLLLSPSLGCSSPCFLSFPLLSPFLSLLFGNQLFFCPLFSSPFFSSPLLPLSPLLSVFPLFWTSIKLNVFIAGTVKCVYDSYLKNTTSHHKVPHRENTITCKWHNNNTLKWWDQPGCNCECKWLIHKHTLVIVYFVDGCSSSVLAPTVIHLPLRALWCE